LKIRNSDDRVPFTPAHENVCDVGRRREKAAGLGNGAVEPNSKLARPTW
jgi:hypothetical protein